jgi:hypothetical protein
VAVPELPVTVTETAGGLIIRPFGDIDLTTAPILQAALEGCSRVVRVDRP